MATYSGKGLSSAYVSGEVTDRTVLDGLAQGTLPTVVFHTNKRWGRVIEKDAYTESLEAFVTDKAHCVKNGKSQVMLPGIHSCYHGICIAIAGVIHLILC